MYLVVKLMKEVPDALLSDAHQVCCSRCGKFDGHVTVEALGDIDEIIQKRLHVFCSKCDLITDVECRE